MKSTLQGKDRTPHCIANLLHKFIPTPQALKIRDPKEAVDNQWKEHETIPAWQLDKVKSNKGVIKEAKNNKNMVYFASLMDIMLHWWVHVLDRLRRWNHNSRSTSVVLCFEEILWKTTLEATQYVLNRAHLHHRWRPQKYWMSLLDDLNAMQMQFPPILGLNLRGAPKLLKIPKSECPDVWIRLPTHNWPKS